MIFGSCVHCRSIWWFSKTLWKYEEGEVETQQQCRDVPMSRRSSVVTLQCRDVWSTTIKVKERPNVVTFPRFLLQNYKKHGRPNFSDDSRTYGRGAENEAGATREIKKTHVFVFLFSKPLMIYRTMLVLNSDIF